MGYTQSIDRKGKNSKFEDKINIKNQEHSKTNFSQAKDWHLFLDFFLQI